MPGKPKQASEVPDIRVFIRNADGKYLARNDDNLFFTDDRLAAIVLSYRADRVPEQLELIRKFQGVALVADPVPPHEIYETCDRCQELFPPFMTYFDGQQFLCPDCRKRPSRRRSGHGPGHPTGPTP